jgi:AraC-like DNA-binding protein
MTVKLVDTNLNERMMEFSMPSLSKDNKLETKCTCYSSKDNEKLIRAKEIIEQAYLNPPSLHRLALMVGTNECKLKNGFKMLFGTTVFGCLFDYRMKMASQYLLDTEKSIQEIAFCTGYEHQSHFSTAFKRKFLVSPQEYRNRMKR